LELKVARNMEKDTIQDVKDISSGVIQRSFYENKVLCTSDAQNDDLFKNYKSISKYRICSFICTPIKRMGEVFGTLYVDSRSVLHLFSKNDVEFLVAFSNLASVAMDSSIKRQQIIAEKNRLENEVINHYSFSNVLSKSQVMIKTIDLAASLTEKYGMDAAVAMIRQ
jgi:GAF domain-containing protein